MQYSALLNYALDDCEMVPICNQFDKARDRIFAPDILPLTARQ